MNEILSLGFMQRAIVAGSIVSIVGGILSIFVLLRKMAFIGVGISHSAFGGVAIGFLLSIDPFWSGISFSVMIALLIEWTRKRGKIEEDTSIGILFSFSMAMGVIFIALSKRYNVDLFGYLFGNILAIGKTDIFQISLWGIAVIIIVAIFFKELIYISFDEEMAWVSGIPVSFVQFLFMVLLAISIIIAIKMIGIILVSSILVMPAAISRQLTDNIREMFLISIITSLFSTIGGLFLSYLLDLPSGAVIVMVLGILFFIILSFNRFYGRKGEGF
jgi:zinc transport system permease protein